MVMTATKPKSAKQRAAAGAKFLDKNRPGWFRKIKRKPLNLQSPCNCILGQLNGDYYAVAYKLGLDTEDDFGMQQLGFLTTDEEDDDFYDGRSGTFYCGPLEVAWWEEIKKRRGK